MLKETKYILRSSKGEIRIDKDEIPKVIDSIQKGNVVILRQGILNPSFFVDIVPDEAGMEKYLEDKKYQIAEGKIKAFPEYKDMFADVREELKSFIPKIYGNS